MLLRSQRVCSSLRNPNWSPRRKHPHRHSSGQTDLFLVCDSVLFLTVGLGSVWVLLLSFFPSFLFFTSFLFSSSFCFAFIASLPLSVSVFVLFISALLHTSSPTSAPLRSAKTCIVCDHVPSALSFSGFFSLSMFLVLWSPGSKSVFVIDFNKISLSVLSFLFLSLQPPAFLHSLFICFLFFCALFLSFVPLPPMSLVPRSPGSKSVFVTVYNKRSLSGSGSRAELKQLRECSVQRTKTNNKVRKNKIQKKKRRKDHEQQKSWRPDARIMSAQSALFLEREWRFHRVRSHHSPGGGSQSVKNKRSRETAGNEGGRAASGRTDGSSFLSSWSTRKK